MPDNRIEPLFNEDDAVAGDLDASRRIIESNQRRRAIEPLIDSEYPVASLFAEDMPTVRQALAYVAEERLTDLCNVLGLKLSEAENLRDRCAELLGELSDDAE